MTLPAYPVRVFLCASQPVINALAAVAGTVSVRQRQLFRLFRLRKLRNVRRRFFSSCYFLYFRSFRNRLYFKLCKERHTYPRNCQASRRGLPLTSVPPSIRSARLCCSRISIMRVAVFLSLTAFGPQRYSSARAII